MGTPGDQRKFEELSENITAGLEEENRDGTKPEPHQQDISSITPEMTIINQLPQYASLINFIQYNLDTKPSPDNKETEILESTSKVIEEPTFIEGFYTDSPKHSDTSDPIETLFTTPDKSVPEKTFPGLGEPGPSGLQTPKSKTGTKVNLKRNKKPQSPKKIYTCQICQKIFQNSNKLTKHQQVHTSSSPFKCEHCKKSFSSKFKLVRHVLIHSDRKPFSCSVCERTFHRKDHLKNHIKVHSPCKKLYICEKQDCKKEYTSSLSYKKHLALHAAEEGILDCQICFKSFKTKEEILYHLKIHAGSRSVKNPDEKKYSCDHCQRKFFTRKDVRRHMVVHTGKRDFLCQFCPQRFGRKDHLVRHIKKSHNKNLPSDTEKEDQPENIELDEFLIKSEADESNLSNPEVFNPGLDIGYLLTENFTMLDSSPQQFLPHTSTQGELTDLGSEILNEITESTSEIIAPMFPENVLSDNTLMNLLQEQTDENLPLPAFSQIFQTPPQPPPPK